MIPPKIARFLEERANIGFAGTRDDNLVPRGHRLSGWHVDSAGRTLTVSVSPAWSARLIEALTENGRIAVTLEEAGTHETYQIKGRYLSHRPVQPADIETASRSRDRFAKGIYSVYPDESLTVLLKASIPTPSLAVEIEIDEMFVQTPGPDAGRRIVPPAAAEPSAR
jgi:hypothetical protein